MDYTQLTCEGDSYSFSSQGNSSSFQFRFEGSEGWASYLPIDYQDQVPPFRGSEKPTIGGCRVKQYFGQYVLDSEIMFGVYLTLDEIEDLTEAKALGTTWTLEDLLGHEYIVSFDHEEGLSWSEKVKANDRYWCKFKFRKESVAT
jgi:hypothetical protein